MAADVKFQIGADLAEFKAALGQAVGEIKNFASQAKAAGAKGGIGDAGFGKVKGSIDSASASLKSFIGAIATVATAVAGIRIADDFANLQARLKLVTDGTESFIGAQERLFQIAQKTGQSFTGIADLYTKLAQATKESGTSQEALLQVTETINQAVQLSGSSAESANAALIQLGQGLASGTLRGEELNSILEQTPVLADAIAKGIGITRGELRKYGADGKITAEAVLNALIKQRDEINKQASQLPLTFGRAMQQLQNSVTLLVGEFDQAAQGTGGFAGAIKDLADFLSSDAVRGAMIEVATTWGNAIRDIARDFKEFIATINTNTGGLVDFIGRAFRDLPINIRAAIRIATVELAAWIDSTITSFKGLGEYIRAALDPSTSLADVRARLLAQQAAIEQARSDSVNAAITDRNKALKDASDAAKKAQEARQKALGTQGTVTIGKGKGSAATGKLALPELRKELDESFRLVKDALDRESRALDQALEDRRISIADWYAEKDRIAEDGFANERARLDRERAALVAHLDKLNAAAGRAGKSEDRQKAEKEIVNTKNQVAKIDADLIILERERATVIGGIARDAAKKEKEYRDAIEETRVALLRAQGKDLDAQLAEIDKAYRTAQERFKGDPNALSLVDQLFNAQTAKAKIDDLQKKVGDFFAFYSEAEKQAAARVELGSLTQLEAEEELQGIRQRSIAQIKEYIASLEALAATTNDPDLLQKIGAAKIQLQQIENTQSKFVTDLKEAGQSGLSTFFTDLASGAKTFKDALSDLVRSFAQAIARMAADALAADLMKKLLGGPSGSAGSGGGWIDKALTWFVGLFHQGGVVGHGGMRRSVNPFIFAGAPRYHDGGMVGLKPNEVPAILEKGETVRTQEQEAALQRSGGFRVVNVVDPSLVNDYMTSSAGEQVILNTIGRNPGYVKQLLGA